MEKDPITHGILSIDTAECLLGTFKKEMIPHFPFVVIPPETSAEYLRREKGFLFLAILASSSFADMPLQRRLGREFKKAVASRMIVNGEVSFELLQGLMVYLAWRVSYKLLFVGSHYHTRPNRYTQFLQLAISIIIDLRLDRPPLTKTWKTPLLFRSKYEDTGEEMFTRPSWGLDEQRAVAGCYYLSSTVAILVQKQFNFRYTPYIEDCCNSLSGTAETAYDKYIPYMIQLQRIVDKIDQLSARHASELVSPGSGAELYVTSLIADLEAFQTRLPFALSEYTLLNMQFHSAELCLCQLSVSSLKASAHTSTPNLRDELLGKALMASNSLLNVYHALPPGTETAFNNTQWVQLGFAVLIASKLLVSVSSNSDRRAAEMAQRRVSWSNILKQCRLRVENLSTSQVDSNGDRDVFHNFRQRVVRIQNWIDEVSERVASQDQACMEGLPENTTSGNYLSFSPGDLFNSMDDPMWSEWINDTELN
ncbi:conserved hypothetical protein [Talaromyces stipitatus ATCC 10500]|uniref:Transcription factor domain-containing protein n=1 Tax=Talaromyces stipitatus (strain ATCC 10500 / CBS 375.48 / QM 6759 / NRRL 1006) TaxID=441959 RepID=B8MLB7_TALSN|nr:uncharacterized protein TSTA_044960 [Talaromyces stipitatus ATCC 10500]EED15032.1 conserved hypothetical protein [Talaromyces stipitatus ATCC 10500]